MKILIGALLGIAVAPGTAAFAQDTTQGSQPTQLPVDRDTASTELANFVAVGLGVAPKFSGSKTYTPIPFVAADVTVKGIELSVRGPDVRADLLGDRSHFSLGPVATLSFGRRPSDGGIARTLDRIGNEVDLGGFVGYHFGGAPNGQGRTDLEITALQDVSNVSKEFTLGGRASYVLLRNRRWNLGVDASATYANAKAVRTYFGVTPREAAVSNLATYSPGAGLRDIGTGLTAGYPITRRWGVVSRLGYTYLVGDAGKSPIVKAGSRSQLLGGIALSYRF